MAFSRPLNVPRQWTENGKASMTKEVDQELLGIDELIDMVVQSELGDEAAVKKYCDGIRPYNIMLSFHPMVPNTTVCRNVFKVFVHYVIVLYLSDDKLEKMSKEDLETTYAIFARLNEQNRKRLPSIPTIQEMKQSMSKDTNFVGPILGFTHLVNRLAFILLVQGNYPTELVYEFRLRVSNMIALYFQAIAAEKHPEKKNTAVECAWRRIFGGAALAINTCAEVFSDSLGKIPQHKATITELHLLSQVYISSINDLYSYFYECHTNSDNLPHALVVGNEADNPREATCKIAEILDAIMMYIYKKAEEIKLKNPNSPELYDVFNRIGQMMIGCYYMHLHLPRYQKSQLAFTLVEVNEKELPNWLTTGSKYGAGIVQSLLEVMRERMADGKMDAMYGAIGLHGREFGENGDGLFLIK
uniref:TPS2 n=1 Tax=Erythropodium caribaeorum TaxID=86550 RepID=A0A8T9VTI8_9CNID|nr:TPS2 [Erythropodium caribaeorum]